MWTGSLIALGLYLPLISGILRDKIEQSFATWLLWVSLDLIALISIILQKGNFKWTWFETFVSFMVLICLIFWWLSGSRIATISSTIAVVISGLPQFKESWQKPDRVTGFIYLGYVVVNVFFFFGGKNWTIEDRFYPGSMIPLCMAIAFAALLRGRST